MCAGSPIRLDTDSPASRFGAGRVCAWLKACVPKYFFLLITFFSLIASLAMPEQAVIAASGPSREVLSEQKVRLNLWHISRWNTGSSQVLCSVLLADGKVPTADDLNMVCPAGVGEEFASTPTCGPAVEGGKTSACKGLFYWYGGSTVKTIQQVIDLPPATIEFTLAVCEPGIPCDQRPALAFSGKEPLSGHKIISLNFRWGNTKRSCDGSVCQLDLPVTSDLVETLEYWSVSDYGDESEHMYLPFRVTHDPESSGRFRMDLVMQPWEDRLPYGSLTWKVLPAQDDPFAALTCNPSSPEALATDKPYQYLAGGLIQSGLAKVEGCYDGGLLSPGIASVCGVHKVLDETIAWQNKYDGLILAASVKEKIPSRLLKAMIAQESQFWPVNDRQETGLGKLTDNGVDMLLTWNSRYYSRLCYAVFAPEFCVMTFPNQSPENRNLIKGAALSLTGSTREFELLAATLNASTHQVNQVLWNIYPDGFSRALSYEDLWKLSIANYYSGSGCLTTALTETQELKEDLSWKNIAAHFTPGCKTAVDYVEKVFGLAGNITP